MRWLMGFILLAAFWGLAVLTGGCGYRGLYHGTGYIPGPPSAYYTVAPTPYTRYSVGY